jgi:hypothetical protein
LPPCRRRKAARSASCLTGVERMSLQRARGKRIAGSRALAGCGHCPDVASRRDVAAMGSFLDARFWHEPSARGRQRTDAIAVALRLAIFDSKRLTRSISRRTVAEGRRRHDTGCRPQEHRPRWPPAPHRRNAADRLRHPQTLPSLNRGAVLASGVAGCPNAVQPELSIVSRLLIGPVGGNGKGGSDRPACCAMATASGKALKRLKNFRAPWSARRVPLRPAFRPGQSRHPLRYG